MVYDAIYHPSCFRSLVSSFKERVSSENETVEQIEDQEQCIKRHLAAHFVCMVSSDKTAAQVHKKNASALGIL